MTYISSKKAKELALELEEQLELNISNKSVNALSISLAKPIDQAKRGKIKHTLDRIEGSYAFSHGSLRELRELEEAYAKFKLYITLGVY